MKTNKDFRLSKQTKRLLLGISDKQKRLCWKNLMIQAELAEKDAKNKKLVITKGDE